MVKLCKKNLFSVQGGKEIVLEVGRLAQQTEIDKVCKLKLTKLQDYDNKMVAGAAVHGGGGQDHKSGDRLEQQACQGLLGHQQPAGWEAAGDHDEHDGDDDEFVVDEDNDVDEAEVECNVDDTHGLLVKGNDE